MKIECAIESINSLCGDAILLRKLYQVVFVSEDLKKLTFYTTTIVGKGLKKDNEFTRFTTYDEDLSIKLQFNITPKNNRYKSIKFKEVTKDFYNQLNVIQEIWGKDSRYIENRIEFNQIIKKVSESSTNTYYSAVEKLLFLEQNRSEYHCGLCRVGNSKILDDNSICLKYSNDVNESKIDGIEMFHAIKTSIEFDNPIKTSDLILNLRFTNYKNVDYLLPDFTYYLVIPGQYEVDLEKTTQKFEKDGSFNDSENNPLSKVKVNKEAYFNGWIEEEYIEEKNVYKLRSSNPNNSFPLFNSSDSFELEVVMEKKDRKTDLQFLLGFIISIFLTYGLDTGRIADVEEYIIINSIIPSDILWLIICIIILFMVSTSKLKRKNLNKERRIIKWSRIISLICYFIWFLLIFVFARSKVLSEVCIFDYAVSEIIIDITTIFWGIHITLTIADIIITFAFLWSIFYFYLYLFKFKNDYRHIKIV